jgi:RNA polymerase sigma factor for flagellar operon FliA
MKAQILDAKNQDRITAGVPFVEALARRMAASMPHSIALGDLVQDGMIGLIDASHRFDETRGIKFEIFAASDASSRWPEQSCDMNSVQSPR